MFGQDIAIVMMMDIIFMICEGITVVMMLVIIFKVCEGIAIVMMMDIMLMVCQRIIFYGWSRHYDCYYYGYLL